jgi:4-diphosphocytidyl-2-C-methyl-D-erythritol kinase
METLRLRAPAKVNLFLRILGRRADGYHLLDSLVVPVSLFDELAVEASAAAEVGAVAVTCEHPAVGPQASNLAYRAAALFLRETGIAAEVRIRLDKKIPVGSGLGGGSSDAAAVLVGLNRLFRAGLGADALCALGFRLGADVPFFVRGRPARVGGAGEVVEPVEVPRLWLVIVAPRFSVSTAWAYRRFDTLPPETDSAATPSPEALLAGGWPPPRGLVVNDLERAVVPAHPEIGRLKEALLAHGAGAAAMSGSGSAVFGLFRERGEAQSAAAHLTGQNGVFVVETLSPSGADP